MHNLWLFGGNIVVHWVASMSGIVSLSLGIVEYFRKQKTEAAILAIVAVFFLIVASEQAWSDEHRNAEILATQKEAAIQEVNFWKSQSYTKDSELGSIYPILAENSGALAKEQEASIKTQEAASGAQKALANLSSKILDISKPTAQKTTAIFFDRDDSQTPARIRVLLLTNKEVTPVDMFVQCNAALKSVMIGPVGGMMLGSGSQRLAPNAEEVTVDSPAWTPTVPFMASLSYYGAYSGADITCSFNSR